MSGYEVEIRTGIKTEHNTLHTWLQIRHADGAEEAWGLHPEGGSDFSNVLLGPGRVKKEDEAKSYTHRSGPIWLSEDQYYDLMDNIHAQKHDPPEYSLVAYGDGEQCSMWAVDRLAEVDAVPSILTPSGTPPLNPFFLDSVAWNPITQTAGFWAHDHYERVSAGLSIALGTPLGLYLNLNSQNNCNA